MATRGCYRYYSTHRPLSIGTFPKPQGNKVLDIQNFDDRTFCGRLAERRGATSNMSCPFRPFCWRALN